MQNKDSNASECPRAVRDFFLPEENDNGNSEYKYYILPASADRFDRLVTQLRWRLNEGDGSCLYEIGVLDDGTLEGISMSRMRESLSYLCAMAQVLGAQVTMRRLICRKGTSLYAVQRYEEAYRELQLEHGLPYAPVARSTPPSDMLQIDLIPCPPCTTNYASECRASQGAAEGEDMNTSSLLSAPMGNDSTESTVPRQRRTLRLARFEAAIREGAGYTHKHVPHRHHGPLRQPCPTDGLAIRWCAEMSLQQEAGFFVDYSSLPC